MNKLSRYIGDLFFTPRFYIMMGACTVLYISSFFIPSIHSLPEILLKCTILLVGIDYFFLFIISKTPIAKRRMAERLSNGDENTISIIIKNQFSFRIVVEIIDELPSQFQIRDWKRTIQLEGKEQKDISYTLRPVERGEYHFGDIILFVTSLLGLVSRRFKINSAIMVPVFPSFMHIRKYELLSKATIQSESGNKRMRKIGHSMEFEQVMEYVQGADVRTLNWKASARKGALMVNTYTDEKSQQVYCIIDKGRLMKMPFEGLTLLDFAINSCLAVSNVCLNKQDRVGLITFSNKIGQILPADRKPVQKENLLQVLYNQKTNFLESDFEMLYMQIRNRIKHRSLLILFTNFESLSGLNRQISYLRSLASHHLLLVIFFENTELQQLTKLKSNNIEEIYIKTVAEKFAFEKRLIVKELMKYGILSILTTPQKLTIETVNKYLELKARQAI